MKQTAVEWLHNQLHLNLPLYQDQWAIIEDLMNQAKEIEKKQIIKTFIDVNKATQKIIGNKLTLKDLIDYRIIAEQYYKETYESND